MSGVKKSGVLLLPEEDEQDASKVQDPKLKEGIDKYLEKQISSRKMRESFQGEEQGDDEEHTGITDDEPEEEEPDYDVISRQSLKASSAALLECMKEARKIHDKEVKDAQGKK